MITAESEWLLKATDLSAQSTTLANGRVLESTIDTLVTDGKVMRLPMGAATGARYRSVNITPIGKGADNDTFTLKLWARTRTSAVAGSVGHPREGGRTNIDGTIREIGTLACTLSTATGVANGVIGTTYRIPDAITWTASGWWSALESAFGVTAGAYSPGSNIPAFFVIPDAMGVEEILCEWTAVSGTTAVNALVERQT